MTWILVLIHDNGHQDYIGPFQTRAAAKSHADNNFGGCECGVWQLQDPIL